jgi:hypothetical protein
VWIYCLVYSFSASDPFFFFFRTPISEVNHTKLIQKTSHDYSQYSSNTAWIFNLEISNFFFMTILKQISNNNCFVQPYDETCFVHFRFLSCVFLIKLNLASHGKDKWIGPLPPMHQEKGQYKSFASEA